ncbi:MAG: helix-turn-helix transcriptional regulator [Clostridia bacterium]|nr:helix-turn-helix transcriptional regulator [Clostridia bacterium]
MRYSGQTAGRQTSSSERISKTQIILNGQISLNELDSLLRDVRPAPKFSSHLMNLLAQRDLSNEDFASLANIGRSTVYKILNGKQLPEQDMLLRMAFVLELSAQEAQQLLKAAQRALLTSSRPRDIAVIVGLNNHLTLDEMDEVLMERSLAPLTPIEKKLSECLAPFTGGVTFDQLLDRAALRTPAFMKILPASGRDADFDVLDAISDDLEKDDLLKIGFALHLKPAEVQRLLRIARRAFLNRTDPRDCLIIEGLASGMTLEDVNAALKRSHLEPLY